MKVVIIDYGSGNLRSAAKAFNYVAEPRGPRIHVTDNANEVKRADYIVLPGVGSFIDCKKGVESLSGMRDSLETAVIQRGVPFLGICVGMQLMARVGYENGRYEGFGWIDSEVVALKPENKLRIPHMGWNDLCVHSDDHPVMSRVLSGTHFYFVHSFHMRCKTQTEVLASVNYGKALCAVVGRANMIGTQFHPEKSQKAGLQFISNFLKWKP